ncbi:hypothetical protein Glove_261g62 [Diversispora epigaea]|uniref:Uncharacterized protein n=1 Tax=Diversispora epigaea TaxID=1348612 RepID=A0A397IEG5_9GLOM|nr:hypothetical protein Glove_261g62 [Diversispora epigaea]
MLADRAFHSPEMSDTNEENRSKTVVNVYDLSWRSAENEMKTIIKTIDSEFSLNYDQTFTSANNCEIRRKLIPELQKSLATKFRPSVTQLTKCLNSIPVMAHIGDRQGKLNLSIKLYQLV